MVHAIIVMVTQPIKYVFNNENRHLKFKVQRVIAITFTIEFVGELIT